MPPTASATLAPQTSAAPAPKSASPRRDPWFDNAKMLLVTLVVVGHSWILLPATELNNRLYDWLYLWHMPAFVMVTGYLSRGFTFSRRNLRRLVTTVLLPYLVFEGLLVLFRVHVGGESFEDVWLNPHWAMWYLIVLFLWRLATPLLKRVPYAVPVSIAVSLAGGLVSVEALDVNRAMALLPFFTIGLMVEPHHLEAVRTDAARVMGLAVLAGAVLVTGWTEHEAGTEWLYYRSSYDGLGVGWLEGAVTRLSLIGVGVAMAAAALAWVPARRTWMTRLGSASLVVYLFHGFFVKGAEYAGVPALAAEWPVLSLVVVSAAAVVVALLLAWRPVAKPLAKVITPAP